MKRLSIFLIVMGLLITSYLGYSLLRPNITAWYLDIPQPQYRVVAEKNVMIPSADGIQLATDIYRPNAPGQFPVLILRTPYDKGSQRHKYPLLAKTFAAQGYVFVVQDVRGKYNSEGTFVPYESEAVDGHATVEWAGRASWSDGNVALLGFSYPGACAWLAATKSSPFLKTIASLNTTPNTYRGWYDRGVPYLKDMVWWTTKHGKRTKQTLSHQEIDEVLTFYSLFLSGSFPD